ncbi:serine hydrolase [Candidatus Curtissbacteria bacterium]|nr:serine hydrolase [Candidatus Curtissbacteria bacterium]
MRVTIPWSMVKKFFVSLAVIALILTVLFVKFEGKKEAEIISPLGKNSPPKTFAQKVASVFENKSKLQTQLENFVRAQDGTYGVYVKDLNTQETVQINSKITFGSASLYKLWVLAEAYNQIKSGQIKKDETISTTRGDLYQKFELDIGEENKDEEISDSLDDATMQMITVSDNDSALLVSDRLGLENISKFMKLNGFKNSNLEGDPQTTAEDIGLFFEKLYKGEIVDRDSSTQMMEILKSQRLNDRLPKYLPEEITVAHKTGELDTFKHDTGIIFGQDPYIVAVLTDTQDPQTAAENIAEIAKETFNYFENKPPSKKN